MLLALGVSSGNYRLETLAAYANGIGWAAAGYTIVLER